MEETAVSLEALSDIACQFALRRYCEPQDGFHCDVLIAAFAGSYRDGADGNDDAVYMTAMLRAAFSAWAPSLLVLDIKDLSYVWGDMMESVLRAGEDYRPWAGGLPVSVVAGPRNEHGLRSLIDDVIGDDPDAWLRETREAAIARGLDRFKERQATP